MATFAAMVRDRRVAFRLGLLRLEAFHEERVALRRKGRVDVRARKENFPIRAWIFSCRWGIVTTVWRSGPVQWCVLALLRRRYRVIGASLTCFWSVRVCELIIDC